ncbi:MAG: hypothetical protein HC872_06035, partial [Gammaproteobacteria bacterium]|nr:hypothetical protein [Gammaproteobacteria bacterium]
MDQPAATIYSVSGPSLQERRGDFDITRKGSGGLLAAALNLLADYPQREWILSVLRRFGFLHLGAITVVLRDDDVREILSHSRDFPVFWADRMRQDGPQGQHHV